MQQFFHQRDFVHAVAHDHGVLCVVLEHAADVGHRPHLLHQFLKFLHRGRVLKIKDLDHLVFVVATLGHVVFGDEDGIRADRLPEGLGQQRDVIQRLVQRYVLQVQVRIPAGLHLRIEQDIDSGQLADRFVQNPGG